MASATAPVSAAFAGNGSYQPLHQAYEGRVLGSPGRWVAAEGGTGGGDAALLGPRPGCKGVCFGAEAICLEAEGVAFDKSWAFVGEGNGGYKQVQEYSYVGDGVGSYDKAETVTVTGWQLRPCWAGLSVFALLVVAAIAGVLLADGLPLPKIAANGRVEAVSRLGQTKAANHEFTFDCSEDDPIEWPTAKSHWCCERFSEGCPSSKRAKRPTPPPAPPASDDAPSGPGADERNRGVPSVAAPAAAARSDKAAHRPGPIAVGTSAAAPVEAAAGPLPVRVTYDCNAGFDMWEWGWAPNKKAFCCTHYDKACAGTGSRQHRPPGSLAMVPYDCQEGLPNWRQRWKPGKRAWCCKHLRLGCPEAFHSADHDAG